MVTRNNLERETKGKIDLNIGTVFFLIFIVRHFWELQARLARWQAYRMDFLWEFFMKTKGEIEAAICDRMTRFSQEYMGRGPRDIQAHLIGDILLVRLRGILTALEQQLIKTQSAENGRNLLKLVRTHLIETMRPVMEPMVEEVTGVKVVSLHQDISTTTGEEVVLFTLAQVPQWREVKTNKR